MESLATVDELAQYLGEPIVEELERKQATILLAAASSLVRSEARQTWADRPAPDQVKFVVLACAGRAFTNPDGWTSEAVDDWRGSGRPVEEAGLFLTATERRQLAGFAPVKPAIGVVDTVRDEPGLATGWVPVEPVSEGRLFPWYVENI